jgi:hypothetical protein
MSVYKEPVYKEIHYVDHDNGEVTPFTVSTHTCFNLLEGKMETEVHIDLTYDHVVDLSESDTAEEDDDNGDDNSWACSTVISKVNSGTCSFSFEVSHFHAFCDNGDICIEYDIEGIDSDEERDSVVSRLSMENDDSNLRCLECATRVYGGWRHCHDCYRFHYRV